MSEAPERIWIEDEFGEGDDDQWVYGTWDVRHYAGYNVEYVRADYIEELEDKLAKAVEALEYADRMVRLDLFHMTNFDCGDFSQAVLDTGERIKATLAELKGEKE